MAWRGGHGFLLCFIQVFLRRSFLTESIWEQNQCAVSDPRPWLILGFFQMPAVRQLLCRSWVLHRWTRSQALIGKVMRKMKRAWLRDDLPLAGHGSFGKAWKPHRKPWNPDWMLLEATTKRVWAFREANQTSVFKMSWKSWGKQSWTSFARQFSLWIPPNWKRVLEGVHKKHPSSPAVSWGIVTHFHIAQLEKLTGKWAPLLLRCC